MFKNALISVSNKTGLISFLRPYAEAGLRIVSTGGTARYLKENGFAVVDVSEQTGFPEVMDGRVKTLHPKIHMALLSRESDQALLRSENIEAFDLLICNLYPFEEAVLENKSGSELIEKIDVGGPSMLRAAAKNFERVTVICDPNDYSWVQMQKEIKKSDRQKLAARAFSHLSAYDSLVSEKLNETASFDNSDWTTNWTMAGKLKTKLRYGENPQQKAAWYQKPGQEWGLHQAEILQGKELSFNNLLDLDAATMLVRQFDLPACVAVKHNNPCGVAQAENLLEAYRKCYESDPISIFGGILALNQSVTGDIANEMSSLFLECVIAPSYTSEALRVFANKKNLRILSWPEINKMTKTYDFKNIQGGFLTQEACQIISQPNNWQWVSGEQKMDIIPDLVFAEKVSASLKSNAIAIVKNGQTLGLGMGQVNRIDAVQHAIMRMKKNFPGVTDVILASDAFFPFSDSIEIAAKARIQWIVQPGGSLKDQEVIQKAKDLKLNMVLTGQRYFRH